MIATQGSAEQKNAYLTELKEKYRASGPTNYRMMVNVPLDPREVGVAQQRGEGGMLSADLARECAGFRLVRVGDADYLRARCFAKMVDGKLAADCAGARDGDARRRREAALHRDVRLRVGRRRVLHTSQKATSRAEIERGVNESARPDTR